MDRLIISSLACLLAVALPQSARSQAAPSTPDSKPDYSQEAYVIERLTQKVDFQNDGTSISETTFRARVQSDAGIKQLGLLIFQYLQASDTMEVVYVRVLKPDGTTVVTPAGNVQDLPADVTREAPFYSDVRQKHVAVRGLSVGDTLEYQVRNRTHTPLIPGQFWLVDDFTRSVIVHEETLEVSVPGDRAVKTKFGDLKPTVAETGGRRIYRWKSSNLKRKTEEELKAEPEEPPPPAVQFTTFQSYEEVGRWYEQLQSERVEPTPEIRAKAAELTQNAKTEDEKLRAIYNYVALKFRYIGIGFGIGRYQPNAAADVLANQYGDCKDKHTLLASLLKAAGISAYPALINSSRKTDPDIPSPSQFDHVITVVPRDDQYLWMDTTAEVSPFGFLLYVLRDKQALVLPSGRAPVLVTTPSEPPFPNSNSFRIEGKLSDAGTFEAKVSRSWRGDAEVIMRAAFRRVPQPQWKDLAQAISYSGGFAGTVNNVDASSPENTDAPFHVDFDYTRKDYSDWENHRLTMPCPPLGLASLKDEEEEKREKLALGGPVEFVYQGKIELPEEAKPNLPKGVDLKEDFGEYHSTYAFQDKVLVSERRLIIKVKEISKDKFGAYRKFAKVANEDEAKFVSVRMPVETGSGTVDFTSPIASEDSSSYVDLMRQGASLLMSRDTEAGIAKIREAVKLEPDCEFCHQALAEALMDKGDRAGAILEYKELVRLEPNNAENHYMLGLQLESRGATRANSGSRAGQAQATRADYEAAVDQYRIAHELESDNKSYKAAYDRLRRQLGKP